jgi:hypothetical protein
MGNTGQVVDPVVNLPLAQGTVTAQGDGASADAAQGHGHSAKRLTAIKLALAYGM